MSIEIKVPPLPESVSDATLVAWHRKAGDAVSRDENLVDLETDKVVLEVPAPASGVLQEIRIQDGATVTAGDVLAILEEGEVAATEEPRDDAHEIEEEAVAHAVAAPVVVVRVDHDRGLVEDLEERVVHDVVSVGQRPPDLGTRIARIEAGGSTNLSGGWLKGRELAEGIRAAADREVTVITANAYRDAEQIRGEGDAEATRVYAEAFNQDPEFYSFYRSLQAYRRSLGAEGDIFVLGPDSEFFRYMKEAGPTAGE